MGDRQHVTKSEYEGIVQKMAEDGQRSDRERQVERAHGQDLPALLGTLHRKHDGNVSAALRELNGALKDQSVSRPTMYNWIEKYGIGED